MRPVYNKDYDSRDLQLAALITIALPAATIPPAIWGNQGLWALLTIPIFLIAYWRIVK